MGPQLNTVQRPDVRFPDPLDRLELPAPDRAAPEERIQFLGRDRGRRAGGVDADRSRRAHRVLGVAVAGEPTRVERSRGDGLLKVVTWNIERGVRFDRIPETLRAMDADVLLLQEADRFCKRSGYRDVPREFAESLGMNWIAAGEFQEIGEARDGVPAITGQAILSRFPIADGAVTVFGEQTPMRWRFNPAQPRRGGRVALEGRTGGVLFFNLHVESGGDDGLRQSQVDEIIVRARRQCGGPAVIAGDFNNSARARAPMVAAFAAAGFADALSDGAHASTHVRHTQPIDWIFAKGATAGAGLVQRVDDASDHFPVLATLADPPGARPPH